MTGILLSPQEKTGSWSSDDVIDIWTGSLEVTATGCSAVNDGNWHHVAIRSSGTATGERVRIYLDGVLKVTSAGPFIYNEVP